MIIDFQEAIPGVKKTSVFLEGRVDFDASVIFPSSRTGMRNKPEKRSLHLKSISGLFHARPVSLLQGGKKSRMQTSREKES